MTSVSLPSAENLDTTETRDDFKVTLWLEPADERGDLIPAVHLHCGVGNIGTPEPGYNGRWKYLCSYGSGAIGESVLEALEASKEKLLAISATYKGRRWDGHNMVGSWTHEDDPDEEDIIDSTSFKTCWTADAWFGPAGINWEELCEEAGVDPGRALYEDLDELAGLVAEAVEPNQGERVVGTKEYALEQAQQWRETNFEPIRSQSG